jgi:hypothetical protein
VCQLFDLLSNALDALIETPSIAAEVLDDEVTTRRCWSESQGAAGAESKVLVGQQYRAPRGSYGFD